MLFLGRYPDMVLDMYIWMQTGGGHTDMIGVTGLLHLDRKFD